MRIWILAAVLLSMAAAGPGAAQGPTETDTTGTGYRFFDRPVDPDRYLIRPGDQLRVTFVHAQVAPLSLNVDPEGRVVHRILGLMDLSGRTLSGTRKVLEESLRELYRVDTIVISITAPMLVGIQVSGAVAKPGSYVAYTSQRVSEIIDSAGGIRRDGSTRRIEFRGGPQPVPVDLDRAAYLGQEAYDPALYAGYAVHVPGRSSSVVDVVGEVAQPRQIEITGKEDLAMLVELAGGFRPTADSEQVVIIRGNTRLEGGETPVQAGDIVMVPPREAVVERRDVIVFGGVNNPGRYDVESHTTLEQLLAAAGGYTDNAAPFGTTVFRLTPLVPDMPQSRERYPIAHLMDREGGASEFELRPGDSVVVPMAVEYVKVSGEVQNPGLYPYEPDKPASYYITAAGGYLPTANTKRVDIFQRVSRTTATYSPEVTVHDGDQIIVQRREELQ